MVTHREEIRVEFASGEFANYLYAKGACFERFIKTLFEEYGWACVRSAGSRGPADVWCADPNDGRVLFIQCKKGEHGETELKKEILRGWCKLMHPKWRPVFAVKSRGILTMTDLITNEVIHTARNPRLKNQGEEKDQWGPV